MYCTGMRGRLTTDLRAIGNAMGIKGGIGDIDSDVVIVVLDIDTVFVLCSLDLLFLGYSSLQMRDRVASAPISETNCI